MMKFQLKSIPELKLSKEDAPYSPIKKSQSKPKMPPKTYLPKLNELKKPNIPAQEPKYKNVEISNYETSFYKNLIIVTKIE